MKKFILDYIGNRSVSFIMILDNAYHHRYGSTHNHREDRKSELSVEVSGILEECQKEGTVGVNEYNFFYRKDLQHV